MVARVIDVSAGREASQRGSHITLIILLTSLLAGLFLFAFGLADRLLARGAIVTILGILLALLFPPVAVALGDPLIALVEITLTLVRVALILPANFLRLAVIWFLTLAISVGVRTRLADWWEVRRWALRKWAARISYR